MLSVINKKKKRERKERNIIGNYTTVISYTVQLFLPYFSSVIYASKSNITQTIKIHVSFTVSFFFVMLQHAFSLILSEWKEEIEKKNPETHWRL